MRKLIHIIVISFLIILSPFLKAFASDLSLAQEQINKNNFEHSREILMNILCGNPSSSLKAETYYLLAEVSKSPSKANQHLKQILNLPENPQTDKAKLLYGKNLICLKDYAKANKYFEEIIINPNSQYFAEALFFSAQSFFQQKKYNQAIMRYKNYLDFGKDYEMREISRLKIGTAYFQQQKYSVAQSTFQRLLNSKNNKKTVPYLLYMTAKIYEKNSQFDDAVQYYKMLINNYPYSQQKPLAEKRIVALAEKGYYSSNAKMPEINFGNEKKYILQMAAFLQETRAENAKNHFKKLGYTTFIYDKIVNGKKYFCLGLESYTTYEQAKYQKIKLEKVGIPSYIYKKK